MVTIFLKTKITRLAPSRGPKMANVAKSQKAVRSKVRDGFETESESGSPFRPQ